MTFALALLFMFLVFWRPQDWLLPFLYGWPILDMVVFMALLTLLLESTQQRITITMDRPQPWLLLGLWIAALMSHVPHAYFEGLTNTLPEVFKFCFFTFLLIQVLDSPAKLRTVAWLFVGMAVFMSVHGLLQHSRGFGFSGGTPMYAWREIEKRAVVRSRFFGIFNDPNDMAQFIVCSMPFAFVLFKKLNVATLLLACGLVAFLFRGYETTDSRGGLIALLVVGVLVGSSFLSPKRQPVVLLLIVAAGMSALPFVGPLMDASARSRIVYWGDANLAFKANPLFGVGYGCLGDYTYRGKAVHNAFVECYASIGVVGYWFWFGLMLSGIVGVLRVVTSFAGAQTVKDKWMRRFSNMSLASLAAFLASSYFLTRAFVYPLFFLVAIVAAVPVICRRQGVLPLSTPFSWKGFGAVNTVASFGSILYIYVSILALNRVW